MVYNDNFPPFCLEEQVHRLERENDSLKRLSERLRDGLEKTKAQFDFHVRNGCGITNCPSLEVQTKLFF
jgi:hypothetical protein